MVHKSLNKFQLKDLIPFICLDERKIIENKLNDKTYTKSSWKKLFDYYWSTPHIAEEWIDENLNISNFGQGDKETTWKMVQIALEDYLNNNIQNSKNVEKNVEKIYTKLNELMNLFEELSDNCNEYYYKLDEFSITIENSTDFFSLEASDIEFIKDYSFSEWKKSIFEG